jgi:hypothetical protein
MKCDYCGQPFAPDPAKHRTKPVRYCSEKCKAAAFRLRQRLFDEHGVTSLVWQVRQLLNAWCEHDDEITGETLRALAEHSLIKHALPIVPPSSSILYSPPPRAARVRPAPPEADPEQEAIISVEMEGK